MIELTTTEAKLLHALGESSGSSYYQLASGAELTPSEVSRAAADLIRKHLAQPIDDEPSIVLTEQGRIVRRSIAKVRHGWFPARKPVSVSIVPDEFVEYRAQTRDLTDVDSALDEAIQRMREG